MFLGWNQSIVRGVSPSIQGGAGWFLCSSCPWNTKRCDHVFVPGESWMGSRVQAFLQFRAFATEELYHAAVSSWQGPGLTHVERLLRHVPHRTADGTMRVCPRASSTAGIGGSSPSLSPAWCSRRVQLGLSAGGVRPHPVLSAFFRGKAGGTRIAGAFSEVLGSLPASWHQIRDQGCN